MTSHLHLPSILIEGFRGIHSLQLPVLGRVTLLAGGNGVGKTTVLDACRFYAARGDGRVLTGLLDTRDEFIAGEDEDGDTLMFPNFSSLFHQPADKHELNPIRIRSGSSKDMLSVRLEDAEGDDELLKYVVEDEEPKVLKVSVGESSRVIRAGPMAYFNPKGRPFPFRRALIRGQSSAATGPWPSPIRNESLGPGMLQNSDVARLWDAVALTEGEDLAIKALRLVVGDQIERVTVVGDGSESSRWGRRAIVKVQSSSVPVPLKRLGDGANRLFAIALALVNCRDGMLFIDEAENGIHYSVQAGLWRMVFRAAEALNVQVIAATHSWDCIAGFAAAAVESAADGTMFRLEQFGDGLEAVPYSEENLEVAARQRTEVR